MSAQKRCIYFENKLYMHRNQIAFSGYLIGTTYCLILITVQYKVALKVFVKKLP